MLVPASICFPLLLYVDGKLLQIRIEYIKAVEKIQIKKGRQFIICLLFLRKSKNPSPIFLVKQKELQHSARHNHTYVSSLIAALGPITSGNNDEEVEGASSVEELWLVHVPV